MGATKNTIVLCEDVTHQLFIHRWLLANGVDLHEILLVELPGKRAGTQHVLSSYAREVREYRKKANHLSSRRLIVAIDADKSSFTERLTAFDEELRKVGLPSRGSLERICILVPKLNIETWLHYFHGNAADEETDFKRRYDGDSRAAACEKAGKGFDSWLKAPSSSGGPPSLLAVRVEVDRLLLR